ncbi:DASH complex subunit ask1 [Escovopsis weberi]|uniref:DASH complex subunit ASK1 n=1 Tax=Escovopsis weberi TaxID=150374 RepID=A0A0M8MVU7_ESCWE|nr:DASH complex subunit ask1 [Escovopsis weberi]
MATRNLSLTEELEKLEQSITLTLQEIDRNFSKAHRIMTTSIIPLVEQYGEHSKAVWEASKFWKQFFEASANVSLSGYEDQANSQENGEEEEDAMSVDFTADLDEEERTRASAAEHRHQYEPEESLLDDADLAGSTPRPEGTRTQQKHQLVSESPYESMKREMRGEENNTTALGSDDDDNDQVDEEDEDSTVLFAQQTARLTGLSMTPRGIFQTRGQQEPEQRQKDPVLHRVLDKTYRVQATPHKSAPRLSPVKGKQADRTETIRWQDSPMSSPEIAIPKLRSEAFMSPLKSNARARLAAAAQGPRTPGVSVQTPAAGRKAKDVFASRAGAELGPESAAKGSGGKTYEIDWESDEEDGDLYEGMSPPKTIQFALPPSKLLQTPGDILLDAGAESSEYSPTMVKMNENVLNDTF